MAKPEQTEIPGTERPKIKPLTDAADEYEVARDTRMEATEAEIKTKDKLQKLLHKYEDKLVDRDDDGNPGYVYLDGHGVQKIAILERSEENVKVKKYKVPKVKDAALADA